MKKRNICDLQALDFTSFEGENHPRARSRDGRSAPRDILTNILQGARKMTYFVLEIDNELLNFDICTGSARQSISSEILVDP
jgi:hypothetical protein